MLYVITVTVDDSQVDLAQVDTVHANMQNVAWPT